jgi:hypothetical protein
MDYLKALEKAWDELIQWVKDGKLVPENEESIQCFLYHGIVKNLDTAIGVRSKPTSDKPRSIFDRDGKLDVGDMHFPDFILGDPKQVVVEIKFARANASILGACKKDILKMKKHHDGDGVTRVFILFDVNPECAFLNQKQKTALKEVDPSCYLWHYPATFNESPQKIAAAKAIDAMKAKGYCFSRKKYKAQE